MKRLIVATFVCALVALIGIEDFASSRVSANKISSARPQDQFVAGRVLVKFQSQVLPEHARQIIAALGARDATQISELGVHILELPAQANESAFIQAFQGRPEIEFAELDHILPPAQQMIPNDPFYNDPNAWALQKINGPEAWFTSTGSPGIIVAILDTGVDGTHPDLAANMVPGWNIYNNNADTSDVRGHGTMVAGTAAASSNNSIGVASVAWGCKIMPVRISDSNGYATVSDIANGLTWAANHGARVANISFNANGYSTVSSAANYFQSKGGLVAVAAGNEGQSVQMVDDRYMLTVGATDSLDSLFLWSNRGNNLDVVAPGHVATTGRGGSYAAGDGTSFAAPIVAGAAALVLSTNPGLTPSQVQNIIKQSADDLGAAGWDSTFGYGRINLAHALMLASGSGSDVDATPPSTFIASPPNGSKVNGVASVLVSASDNVAVVKVELYVDGALQGSSVTSPFSIKWNTRKATKGAHTLVSKAYDEAGNVGNSSPSTVYK